MRLVIQRVSEASVTIGGELHSSIGKGLFILVGVFGADMQCALINDGPVTIIIDSRIKE